MVPPYRRSRSTDCDVESCPTTCGTGTEYSREVELPFCVTLFNCTCRRRSRLNELYQSPGNNQKHRLRLPKLITRTRPIEITPPIPVPVPVQCTVLDVVNCLCGCSGLFDGQTKGNKVALDCYGYSDCTKETNTDTDTETGT